MNADAEPATPPEPPSRGRRRRWRRVAGIASAVILALVLLVTAALAWVVATPAGLQFAAERLRPHLPPGVSIGAVEGRLVGPLTVHDVQIDRAAGTLRVDSAMLEWSPRALLWERLDIDAIELDGVAVEAAASAGGEAPGSGPVRLPALPARLLPELPVTVDVQRLRVTNAAVSVGTGATERIASLQLRARLDDQTLTVDGLRLDAERGQLEGELSLSRSPAHDVAGRLDWSLQPNAAHPRLAGSLRLEGSLQALRLEHSLQAPAPVELQAQLEPFGDSPQWQADLDWPALRPADWLSDLPPLTLAGELDLAGTFERARVKGDFRLGALPGGPYSGSLAITADPQGLAIERLVLAPEGGQDAQARLTGQVDLAQDEPRFDLTLDWQDLRWPLADEAAAVSPEGRLQVQGTTADYGLDLALEARAPDTELAPATGEFEGRGSLNGLDPLTGRIEWDGAVLELDGGIDWGERLHTQWAARLADLSLERVTNGRLAGELGARANLEAGWGASGPRGSLRIERLRGELNGRDLGGEATIEYSDGTVELPRLAVDVGAAQMRANGRLDKTIALDWSLKLPDVAELVPAAAGRLEGSGRVRGEPSRPAVTGQLAGDGLAWGDWRLGRLRVSAQDVAPGSTDASASLEIQQLRYSGTRVERIEARLTGGRADHRLRLEASSEQGSAAISVAGALDDADWRGRITTARLERAEQPPWELREATALAWVEGEAELDRTCLERGPASVCLAASGDPSSWRARAEAGAIPLALLGAFGPPALRYEGELAGTARLAGGDEAVTGQVNLELTGGALATTADEEQEELLRWAPGSLEATLDAERLDARLQLPLTDGGRIAVTAGLGRQSPHALAGRIDIAVDDPSVISAFVPQIGRVQGRLQADLELGGDLGAPRLNGSASLAEGRVGVIPLGIELSELDLELEAAGAGVRARLSAVSGEGRLQASLGFERDAAGAWVGEGRISGEDFLATALPELKLVLSPDLRWRVEQRLVEVRGDVSIPQARIAPKDLSATVQSSPDAVVVGERAQAEGDADPGAWRVDADVGVELGPAVRIAAFGLEGRLAGALQIRERPGKLTTASGELRVEEGEYSIYRQTLEIARGRVLFEGGPIADPGLDVRAVRRPRDVVVGVNVRGSLRNPNVTLFSEPSMPESQQLSYLVAGVPLGESSGGDQNAMAAIAGKLAQSEQGRALANRVGIDEISLDRSGGEGAALVLGRYLSPRLYVGYGIGLAEQANSVRLRYELSRRWSVEGRSGTAASADLLYSIESD